MRFLGVDLGSGAHADGIHYSTIDAATRFRVAAAAVGEASTRRLMAFVTDGLSLVAVSAKTDMSRQDLAGAIVADLERLAEHYAEVDRTRRARRPGRSA
ncbi:MAG TPA: hypothetical protein VNR89_11895 [Roseomonas sp.]|nr:hypothetical protein [Roseomonas sp.]